MYQSVENYIICYILITILCYLAFLFVLYGLRWLKLNTNLT